MPQGHEVEAPDRLRVVARGRVPALRARRAGPGAGPYPDLDAQPRVLHQPHRLVDEGRVLLDPPQDAVAHCSRWSARSPSCRCYDSGARGVAGRQLPRLDGRYSALPAADEPVTEGTLTKAALVEQVAHDADLTKKHTEVIVETVFGSIAEALRRGEKVEIRGFGSFRLRRRAPRRGRNPRTGDRVDVASKHVAYFTPGKELKELINRDPAQPVPSTLSE